MILCAIMIAVTYDQRVLRTMHGIDKSCESCGSEAVTELTLTLLGGFNFRALKCRFPPCRRAKS